MKSWLPYNMYIYILCLSYLQSFLTFCGLNGVVVTVLFSILKWPKLKVKKKTDKIPSKNNVIGTEGLETRCFFFFKKLLIVVYCLIC